MIVLYTLFFFIIIGSLLIMVLSYKICFLSLEQCVQISQIIAAFSVALTFLLYNIRAKRIEIDKIRIQYIINSYKSFSLFINYLRQWRASFKSTLDISDDEVMKRLFELNNEAVDLLAQAELYLKPLTYKKMSEILYTFRLINFRFASYKVLKEKAERENDFKEYSLSSHYWNEATKEFKIANQELPDYIEKLFKDIHNDFYLELNGKIEFFRFNIKAKYSIILSKIKKFKITRHST